MSYQVGIDLGTTYSAAAVCRPGGGAPEVVPLGQRAASVPSTVYIGSDGVFQIGEAAERHALSDPGRVVREFKRRIGDPTPVHVGREPLPAEELASRYISRLLQDVAAREGAVASRVAVTHPAGWGPHKLESLRAALTQHGMRSAVLLSEPQAAAVGYASKERVEPGAVVAVYDLGGGTFDAGVVRKSAGGGFELLGTPEGLEHLGGVDFDEVVFSHVRSALGSEWSSLDPSDPDVLAAVAGLRRECTAAKEALSHDTEVLISVVLPGVCTQVRLGRTEFEEMIAPAVQDTMAALHRALESAGVKAADLGALLLVGGSSRIPLITQLVSSEFGRSAAVDVDPKGVIAGGAAVVARELERGGGGAGRTAGSGRAVGSVAARGDARVAAAAEGVRHAGVSGAARCSRVGRCGWFPRRCCSSRRYGCRCRSRRSCWRPGRCRASRQRRRRGRLRCRCGCGLGGIRRLGRFGRVCGLGWFGRVCGLGRFDRRCRARPLDRTGALVQRDTGQQQRVVDAGAHRHARPSHVASGGRRAGRSGHPAAQAGAAVLDHHRRATERSSYGGRAGCGRAGAGPARRSGGVRRNPDRRRSGRRCLGPDAGRQHGLAADRHGRLQRTAADRQLRTEAGPTSPARPRASACATGAPADLGRSRADPRAGNDRGAPADHARDDDTSASPDADDDKAGGEPKGGGAEELAPDAGGDQQGADGDNQGGGGQDAVVPAANRTGPGGSDGGDVTDATQDGSGGESAADRRRG